MMKSLITERLSELGSAWISVSGQELHLKGFMSEERLHDYFDKGVNCLLSEGVYSLSEIRPQYMPDNSLLIIVSDGVEQKSQFIVIKTMKIEYKSPEYKSKSKRLCKFRKDVYSGQLNYIDDKVNLTYENLQNLHDQLTEIYGSFRFLEIS